MERRLRLQLGPATLAATAAVVVAVISAWAPLAEADKSKKETEKIPVPDLVPTTELLMPGNPQAEAKEANGELSEPPPPFTDSNSPAYWVGSTFFLIHSASVPVISFGTGLEDLGRTAKPFFPARSGIDPELIDTDFNVSKTRRIVGGHWIESTHTAEDGMLYGWYHFEPTGLCPGRNLTAPFIGAAASNDNGRTWRDLGLVLAAPTDTVNCDTPNEYFAGGVGDFTVVQHRDFFYFLFSTYAGDRSQQGVAAARMHESHLADPVGQVFKWRKGSFSEPGLGGEATPIWRAETSWHEPDARAYWGPSVHWNTYLERYVMLLNLSVDSAWAQGGVYVSYNRRLSHPEEWSKPKLLVIPESWYPQVIGTDLPGVGTDKLAGKKPRFFLHGESFNFLRFHKPKK